MFARLYARYAFVFGSTKALPYRLKSSAQKSVCFRDVEDVIPYKYGFNANNFLSDQGLGGSRCGSVTFAF